MHERIRAYFKEADCPHVIFRGLDAVSSGILTMDLEMEGMAASLMASLL